MHYGTTLAFVFWLFSVMVAFSSMGVVVFFDNQDLIETGQLIILVIACGGGLGFLVWIKQRVNDPLVNVSCTIAALPIVSVVTKDPATQQGFFSSASVTSTLYMLIMAIIITTLVNVLVRPVFARADLRDNLVKATTSYATVLAGITSGFLSGSEEDLKHAAVKAAEDAFNSAYGALDANLSEAHWEHYLLGTEKCYEIEQRLVKCMQRLAQDIGGVRSAATTQFYLLAESAKKGEIVHRPGSPGANAPAATHSPPGQTPLLIRDFAPSSGPSDDFPFLPDDEQATASQISHEDSQVPGAASRRVSTSKLVGPSAASADHMFTTFIEALGPSLVRLITCIS